MEQTVRVGIIGDFDQNKISHPATIDALKHASTYLSVRVDVDWLPTASFHNEKRLNSLVNFDCLWASSGSPYQSTQGALNAIQRARELNKPFIGT